MPFYNPDTMADSDLIYDASNYSGVTSAATLSTIPSPRAPSPHEIPNLEDSPPNAQLENLPFMTPLPDYSLVIESQSFAENTPATTDVLPPTSITNNTSPTPTSAHMPDNLLDTPDLNTASTLLHTSNDNPSSNSSPISSSISSSNSNSPLSTPESTISTPEYKSSSPSYSPINTALHSDSNNSGSDSSMIVEIVDGGYISDTEMVDQPPSLPTISERNYIISNRPLQPHFCILESTARSNPLPSSSYNNPSPYDACDEAAGNESLLSTTPNLTASTSCK